MTSNLKKKLIALVETLPEEELLAARRYLEYLRDQGNGQYECLDQEDPFDDMDEEELDQLHASINRGLEQMRQGKGRPAEEFLKELQERE